MAQSRLSERFMLAQHPIIADDGRVARLRRLDATLVDAAAKRPERLEAGDRSILSTAAKCTKVPSPSLKAR